MHNSFLPITLLFCVFVASPAFVQAQRIVQGKLKDRDANPLDARIIAKRINNEQNIEEIIGITDVKKGRYRIVLSSKQDSPKQNPARRSQYSLSNEIYTYKLEIWKPGYVTTRTFPFSIQDSKTITRDFTLVPFRGPEMIGSLADSLFVPLYEIELNSSDPDTIVSGLRSAVRTLNYRYFPIEIPRPQRVYLRTEFKYQQPDSLDLHGSLKVSFLIEAQLNDEPSASVRFGAAWVQKNDSNWRYDLPADALSFITEDLANKLLHALTPIRKP